MTSPWESRVLWLVIGVAAGLVYAYWDQISWYQSHQSEIDAAKAAAEGLRQMGVLE